VLKLIPCYLFPKRCGVMNSVSDPVNLVCANQETVSDSLPSVVVDGLRLHAVTERACIRHIVTSSQAGRGGTVVTANLDHLRRYQRDLEFRHLVDQADLIVADGMPLIWASRLQGTALPERVTGSSLISTLTAAAAEAGLSVFLLGGDPGTAELAASLLRERHPNLRIAGTLCPRLPGPITSETCAALAEQLQQCQPDLVFVALGSPKTERLIAPLCLLLPHAWWLGVGISFSFVCGRVARAPVWMQNSGLEWLHRLWQEPHRLARRYLIDGLSFGVGLLLRAACRRFRRGGSLDSRRELASAEIGKVEA
jgi:N-acetylglucosaminyldiphosphoundecaprenol N-acetyl-beta-D-mannosaminyltransferase